MMEKTLLLAAAYLGPVDFYARLYGCNKVCIEQWDHYVKQTYRNRCRILAAGGVVQTLTVPVVKPEYEKMPYKDIRISDHGNWRHLHWQALVSAYRNSPYFEYYEEDFLPFYTRKYDFLLDFNLSLQEMICKLIGIEMDVELTSHYIDAAEAKFYRDYREIADPGRKDCTINVGPYYQVFPTSGGFQPDLSIVDLLFNMGPESLIVLRDANSANL